VCWQKAFYSQNTITISTVNNIRRGDLLLVQSNTWFARRVASFTGNSFNHLMYARTRNSIYDFSISGKFELTLDELLEHPHVDDVQVYRGRSNVAAAYDELFENSLYDSKAIIRIAKKLVTSGRDEEDVRSSPAHNTCASIIAQAYQQANSPQLNYLPCHHSQFMPHELQGFLRVPFSSVDTAASRMIFLSSFGFLAVVFALYECLLLQELFFENEGVFLNVLECLLCLQRHFLKTLSLLFSFCC